MYSLILFALNKLMGFLPSDMQMNKCYKRKLLHPKALRLSIQSHNEQTGGSCDFVWVNCVLAESHWLRRRAFCGVNPLCNMLIIKPHVLYCASGQCHSSAS